jgi:hypothetical protein
MVVVPENSKWPMARYCKSKICEGVTYLFDPK